MGAPRARPYIAMMALDLDTLASFNRIARHGGVAEASRATGRPKSTLARHVRALEDSLGVRLIERGRSSAVLTEAGTALRARTEGLILDIEAAAREVTAGGTSLEGRLRISVPVLFANVSMGRIAAAFRETYPGIEIEIYAEDRMVDLVKDQRDVAIRVRPPQDEALVGRCFARDETLIVAPPTLPPPLSTAGRAGPPTVPAVSWVGDRPPPTWYLTRDGRTVALQPVPVLRVSALMTARDAVCGGAGAARLPRSLVADDIASGRMVCWGVDESRAVDLWVLHTARRLANAKVTAFVQFLCAYYEAAA